MVVAPAAVVAMSDENDNICTNVSWFCAKTKALAHSSRFGGAPSRVNEMHFWFFGVVCVSFIPLQPATGGSSDWGNGLMITANLQRDDKR